MVAGRRAGRAGGALSVRLSSCFSPAMVAIQARTGPSETPAEPAARRHARSLSLRGE